MSEDVKRYDLSMYPGEFKIVRSSTGRYVELSDYESLRSQLEAANADVQVAKGQYQGACDIIKQLEQQVADLTARKDGAYLERNQVVAALAKCFPSGKAKTAIEGWSEDWHNCVYIDLPTGQVSWHYHDSHAPLFEGLPEYAGQWDGHDTPEKYARLGKLTAFANKVAERAVGDERLAELEKRMQQLEIARMPFGPLPKQPNGGPPCPKLTPHAAIEAQKGRTE